MKPDQIIEHFLEALRHDPNAPAPPYMREETAAFLRTLVRAESAMPSAAQRARIWQRALSAAQRAESDVPLQGEKAMFHVEPLRAKRTTHYSWTVAAAMGAVVLMIAAVLLSHLPPSDGNILGSAQNSTATATVTASATLVPSATPLIGTPCPTVTPLFVTPPPSAMWTATPIGGSTPSDCLEPTRFETPSQIELQPTVVPPLNWTATPIAIEASAQIESVRHDSEKEVFVIAVATRNSAKIARYRLEVALASGGKLLGIFFFDAPPHNVIQLPYAALSSSSTADRALQFTLYGLDGQDRTITLASGAVIFMTIP
jgi:hypothetical protein